MNNEYKFWLVWNPRSVHAPSYRHETRASADIEAKRLAGQHPCDQFFVLEAMAYAETEKPKIALVRLDQSAPQPAEPTSEEIPF